MNKKISAGIGLLAFLLLLPLENVYADGCDHSFEKLSAISVILMIAVASIIFASIFAKDKDLLVKVMVFCIILVLLFLSGVYLIFVLAAIIRYTHIRFPLLSSQEKKRIKKFICIFVFLLIVALLCLYIQVSKIQLFN